MKNGATSRLSALREYLPAEINGELDRLFHTGRVDIDKIGELRIRAAGVSSLRTESERIRLEGRLSFYDTERVLEKMTGGSLYAFRDSIAEGYIPLACGVRVGIAGLARYEHGTLVGISHISSLVFRIPTASSPFCRELVNAFRKCKRGMLIYSPVYGGKTTAIRSLSAALSRGKDGKNVTVIDERREFSAEEYRECSVDILSGYKKSLGMEIALRSLSPDVIMVDEVGGKEEALAMLPYMRAGIPIVATAHGASAEEVMKRENLAPFFCHGVFDTLVGLRREGCEVRFLD